MPKSTNDQEKAGNRSTLPSAEVPCCVHPIVPPRAQCRSSLLCTTLCPVPRVAVPCCVLPCAQCPVSQFLAVYCPVPSIAVPCCVLPCAQCRSSLLCTTVCQVPSVAIPCCVLPCAQCLVPCCVLPCAQCRSSLLCTTLCPVPQFLAVYYPVPSAQCRSSLLCTTLCPVSQFLAVYCPVPSAQCRSSFLCTHFCTDPCPVPSVEVPCGVHPAYPVPKFLAVYILLYCPVPQSLAVSTLHAQCRSSLLCPPYMPSAAVPCCVHPTCPVPQSLAVSTQHAQCRSPLLCPRSTPSAAVPCCVHAACPVSKSLAVSTTHAHAVPQLLALSTLHAPPRAPATAGRQRSNRPFINTVTAGDEWGVRAGALSGEFRRSVSRPVPEPRSLAGPVPGKGRKWMSGPVSVLMK